jgi:hypothetical protein
VKAAMNGVRLRDEIEQRLIMDGDDLFDAPVIA